MSICELIPREFKAPFRDPRSAYRALSPLELFYLLSGINGYNVDLKRVVWYFEEGCVVI